MQETLFPVSDVAQKPSDILSHHADHDAADSFIAWRKTVKKPLTERAAIMIAKTLSAINQAGGDATEALDLAQEHGWMTIKPEWYWKVKHGNGNRETAKRSDPGVENILRLTGLSQASSDGGAGTGGDGKEAGPLWMGTGSEIGG